MELDPLLFPSSVLPLKEQFPGLGPHGPPQQNSGPAPGWARAGRAGAGTLGQERIREDKSSQEEGRAGAAHQACPGAAQHLGEVPSLPLGSHAHPFIAPWTLKLSTRDGLGPGADSSLQGCALASSQSCLAPSPCSSGSQSCPRLCRTWPGSPLLLLVAQHARHLWH